MKIQGLGYRAEGLEFWGFGPKPYTPKTGGSGLGIKGVDLRGKVRDNKDLGFRLQRIRVYSVGV